MRGSSSGRSSETKRGSAGGVDSTMDMVLHSGTLEVYTEPSFSMLSTTKKAPYWRAHHFLMEGKKLIMMSEKKAVRTMELNHLVSARSAPLNELGRAYCFVLTLGFVGPGSKLILNATDDDDRDEWVSLINTVCASKTVKAVIENVERRKSSSSFSREAADESIEHISPIGKSTIPTTPAVGVVTTPATTPAIKEQGVGASATSTKKQVVRRKSETISVTLVTENKTEKRLSFYTGNIFALLALFGGTLLTKVFVDIEPYMDEVFHIPQAQKYCEGTFYPDGWDSKITTFPGVYMLSFALKTAWEFSVWAFREVKDMVVEKPTPASYWLYDSTPTPSVDLGVDLCSKDALRAQSMVLGCLIFLTSVKARRALLATSRESSSSESAGASTLLALVVTLFPVSAFFYFLFYTDTVSTLLLVLSVWTASSAPGGGLAKFMNVVMTVSAGAGAIAVRQTNAVWIAFLAGAALIPRQGDKQESETTLGSVGAFLKNLLLLNGLSFGHFKAAFLLAPVGAFAYFVVYMNEGSVVLGDKANHAPVLHWAMPMHALALMSLMLLLVSPPRGTTQTKPALGSLSAVRILAHTVGMAGVTAALYYSSLDHPFLLADNRHYTFYVWKRFLADEKVRIALGPLYYFLIQRGLAGLAQTNGIVWVMGFLVAVALTLVPTPLLEPRYFTPTVIVGLLASPSAPTRMPLPTSYFLRLMAVIILFLAANAATLYVFSFLPFKGAGGEVARFMY